MAVTTLPPELQTVLRDVEVKRLFFEPSFRAVLPVERVPPTYTVQHIKTDQNIVVTRSRRGDTEGGARGTLVQDRESNPMVLFKARMDISWFDQWMAEQRAASGALPIPVGPLDAIQPQRLFTEMLAQIDREVDNFMFGGDLGDAVGTPISGMIAQDPSPLSNAATLDTIQGRQEFVENVALARKEAKLKFAVGQPVLAVDAAILHYLDFPFQEGGGAGGMSALQVLQGTQNVPGEPNRLAVVPVQNPLLSGKAILHYRDVTNAAYYDSTPEGAVPLVFGDDGEDKQLVLFKQLGLAFRRSSTTSKVWRTLDSLSP